MTFDVGIDMVSTERFSEYEDISNVFLNKIFTKKEIEYCFSKMNRSQALSGKYAAKEAVIKVLSNKGINISHLRKIEIGNASDGKPFIKSCPIKGIKNKIKLSISHESNFAIAVAVIN